MFEVFRGKGRRDIGSPAVTLTKAGNINLNRAVLDAIPDANFVHLMFDKDNRRLGLKFMKRPEDRYSYPVKKNEKSNSAMISGRAFMKNYSIPFTVTTSYDATVDKPNNMVVVNLTETEKKKIK